VLVICALYECASANHYEIAFIPDLDRLRETVETGVTPVFNFAIGFHGLIVGSAAIRIAELYVLWRRLKRLADRVVVRDYNGRGLITINQEQSEA
jgi:hypothetical protein